MHTSKCVKVIIKMEYDLLKDALKRINEMDVVVEQDIDDVPEIEDKDMNHTPLLPIQQDEIQKKIRGGAKDLDQNWNSAIDLVNKAYKVLGYEVPRPAEPEKWDRYEDNLAHAVKMLSKYRGTDGKWRTTTPNK